MFLKHLSKHRFVNIFSRFTCCIPWTGKSMVTVVFSERSTLRCPFVFKISGLPQRVYPDVGTPKNTLKHDFAARTETFLSGILVFKFQNLQVVSGNSY